MTDVVYVNITFDSSNTRNVTTLYTFTSQSHCPAMTTVCTIHSPQDPHTPNPQPKPSLAQVQDLLENGTYLPPTVSSPTDQRPNLVPVYIELPADLLTPVAAYLKIANTSQHSFLLESVVGGESLARYSFVGADPLKTIRTGPEYIPGDPLKVLQSELEPYRYVKLPEVPTFTGESSSRGMVAGAHRRGDLSPLSNIEQ